MDDLPPLWCPVCLAAGRLRMPPMARSWLRRRAARARCQAAGCTYAEDYVDSALMDLVIVAWIIRRRWRR